MSQEKPVEEQPTEERCPAKLEKGICFAGNNDIPCDECIERYERQKKIDKICQGLGWKKVDGRAIYGGSGGWDTGDPNKGLIPRNEFDPFTSWNSAGLVLAKLQHERSFQQELIDVCNEHNTDVDFDAECVVKILSPAVIAEAALREIENN